MSNDQNIQREYLYQAINQAANHLKLSAEKIEMVGLLREEIHGTSDIEAFVTQMKKVTDAAKLALKFSDIINYLNNNKIEYSNISEKFKQHSFNLVKELSIVLDSMSLSAFRGIIARIKENMPAPVAYTSNPKDGNNDTAELQKENFILQDVSEQEPLNFYKFEEIVTKPISSLDSLLKRILQEDYKSEEILYFANVMKKNWSVSKNFDSQIISNMHEIVSKSLFLISNDALTPNKEIVDALRACLIVIVALIKNKEIDISVYLRKSEELGNSIKTIKVKEF